MCGIAGILNQEGSGVSPVVLRAMTDAIQHRGPDGEGFYSDAYVGLGHRRLAVIDISEAGHQPMMSEDKSLVISYNGEVYNYRELRLELEANGYRFHSETDTEVVLNAWREWGSLSVQRLNGMFAFGIWDTKKRTLHLVRDRYGIKPLYFTRVGKLLIFGSEQKAILQHPGISKSVDGAALLEYFTFQNIFTDRTLLSGIKILEAGSILKVSAQEGSDPVIERYWDYRFQEPEGKIHELEYREELDRLLQKAVSTQLVTDVELGSYLSGGMDSGTLTALAARQIPNLKTFTCGFDLTVANGIELRYDERAKAEQMSARYRTEQYEMVIKSGDMERCLPKLAYHIEEPRVGQCYPNYYAAQLASKFVTVVLSGAGGDELFAGYPWRYYRASVCRDFDDYIDQYYLFWQRLIPNRLIKEVFKPIGSETQSVWTRDIFKDVFKTHENELKKPEDYINHSLYFEAKTFLHGLFVIEDKISMAHSLETRVPFMDNDLVEFAMKCPVGLKLNNLAEVVRLNENEAGRKDETYFRRSNDGKTILRNVMSKYIDNEIVKGEKQGFSSPDASWFKGQSMRFVQATIMNRRARMYQYLDFNAVCGLVSEHLVGRTNRRLLIWSLLNFEQWLEQYDM